MRSSEERMHAQALQTIWFFIKDYKFRIVAVVSIMIISGISEALNLAALYPIINFALEQGKTAGQEEFLSRIFEYLGIVNQFRFSCILLVYISILAASIKLFNYYLVNKFVKTISEDVQKAIFERFSLLEYKYFVKNKQGYLVYANTIAPQGVSNLALFTLRVINSVMSSLSLIFFLVLISWKVTSILLLCGFFYFMFIKRLTSRLINQCAKLAVEADREKNVILNEFINGIKSIKVFQTIGTWKDQYSSVIRKSVSNNFKVLMGKSIPEPTIKCTLFLLAASFGIFFSFRKTEEVISIVPLLGTFMAFVSRLFPCFNQLGNDLLALSRNFPDAQIAYNILNEGSPPPQQGSIIIGDFQKEIVFDQVSFKYDDMNNYLLKNLSFRIPARNVTAIVGPSGSGKTSIINLILKLYDVVHGRILIDGVDIHEIKNSSYLSIFGFIGQETFIFNGSIIQNILFGRTHFSFQEVERAAQLANAEEFILEKAEGYETLVGDGGIKLSGGQKQRIALARAILSNPKILILDEATSSLDHISERMIQEALNKICQNTTILIVAHRLSTVQQADKIIVLEKGEVIEEGTHHNLLERHQKYFELYTASLGEGKYVIKN